MQLGFSIAIIILTVFTAMYTFMGKYDNAILMVLFAILITLMEFLNRFLEFYKNYIMNTHVQIFDKVQKIKNSKDYREFVKNQETQ